MLDQLLAKEGETGRGQPVQGAEFSIRIPPFAGQPSEPVDFIRIYRALARARSADGGISRRGGVHCQAYFALVAALVRYRYEYGPIGSAH